MEHVRKTRKRRPKKLFECNTHVDVNLALLLWLPWMVDGTAEVGQVRDFFLSQHTCRHLFYNKRNLRVKILQTRR